MSARRWFAATAAAIAASCTAPSPFPSARFANAPIAWAVDDHRDVAVRPPVWPDLQDLDSFDAMIERPITRALELPRARRALGVNAVDEVPDSTWFTNRIGVHDLSPQEITRGPLVGPGPEAFRPWRVTGTKPGGVATGLIVTDTRGVKYELKFDDPGLPELESATHTIVNRLLWACGYAVPQDEVVLFTGDDLVVAPGAKIRTRAGLVTGPLTSAALAAGLAAVPHALDGRVRALASRWVPGEPIGGPTHEGVRREDPNDRIPHELRRDQRGEYPIFAWLDRVDVSRGNSIDTWVANPGDPRRHYIEHYQIDFGRALGVMGLVRASLRFGYTYEIDYGDIARSIATLGFGDHVWEHDRAPDRRGVSPLFVASSFDPGAWQPDLPYAAFLTADRFDKFWGAALMARFSPEQIRAAVEAGQLSDPRAAAYLTATLVARQRATLAYWFARVAPIVRVTADANGAGAMVCFDDLAITAGLATPAATHYTITGHTPDARPSGTSFQVAASPNGRTCAALSLAPTRDGYTIFELVTQRAGVHGETFLYVARDPATGAPRVVGLWRT